METRIWKYGIGTDNPIVLDLPKGAVILGVVDNRGPTLYARVDRTAPLERVRLFVSRTGHPLARDRYIDTVIIDDRAYHYFEIC